MKTAKIIKDYGFTLLQVADIMNVSKSTLSHEIGEKGNPTVATLHKIADAINHLIELEHKKGHVSVMDFFYDENTPDNRVLIDHATYLHCPQCGRRIRLGVIAE